MKLSPQTIAANIAAAAAELEEQQSAAAAAAATNSNSTSTTTTTSNNNNISANAMVSTASTGSAISNSSSATGAQITSTGGSSAGMMNQQQQQQQQQGNQLQNQAQQNQAQQQQTQQQSAVPTNPPGKSTPKDTQVVAAILKEMGITEYEPRVLPQLVEFAYRYASRVLEDAQLFSSYAKKKNIDSDDVGIAVQMQMERSFVGPPPRDALLEIARNKNTQQLPPIKSHNGMRLPADRYSLVAANLRLVSANNSGSGGSSQSSSAHQANKGQMMMSGVGLAKPRPNPSTNMLTKSVFPVKTSVVLNPSTSQQQSSSTTGANSEVMGVKRRLDET